ncbi:MAG: hypothetical protein WA981_03040 [Glaciecola sp.]
MYKARRQANFRKKIAYIFYFLAVLNALVKVTGLWPLDTSSAITSSEAVVIKMAYYFLPLVLLAIGGTFNLLSKVKASQAEAYNMRGSSW